MVRLRVRIRFGKQGDLRLIGHRDLMRCFERLFRRAGLTLSFSEGFHPKPRMTFPLALAVGIEGIDEVMEFELAEQHDADELMQRLTAYAPPGLVFHKVEILPERTPKVQVKSASYEAHIPAEYCNGLTTSIDKLLASASWPVERGHGRKAIDVRPFINELALCGQTLKMKLSVSATGSVGPREILAALGLADIEHKGAKLCRTEVEVEA